MKVKIGKYKKDGKLRNINVRIDDFDIWSADHTIALIVHPILLKMLENPVGSAFVDDSDVPEHLWSTVKPKKKEWDLDGCFHDRWVWVLNEMAFAFGEYASIDNEYDFIMSPERIDRNERIQNGLRLFGKYYSDLWT